VSVRALRRLEEEAGEDVELVASGGLVERLRRRKDEAELEAIAAAARLADEVFEWLAERGLAGHTERDVARAAEARIRELGGEPSFSPIVAGAQNGAVPHHEPSEREIGAGELVIIDMGAELGGYCSDCTRTYATGPPGEEATEIYELVRSAQAAALDAIAPGVSGVDADLAAREPIEAAGYGELFGHGTGHGVGMEVHEGPRLGKSSEDVLEPGDVVTVEPGVYLPGRFGVRIEDLVTVTADGHLNLSGVPKELRVVD
jgi:Xaa-Pro aminopeptidase